MADSVLDIITDSLLEIGAYGPGDVPLSASDAALALRTLNREMDAWAASKRYVYADVFTQYTLIPNHAPHTIGAGVGADFVVSQRPVRLEGAGLVLTTVTPNVDSPILNIRDGAWWKNQRVKSLASAIPTDVYYEPDWPNGALNFWPVPNFAYGIRLQLWTLISQFVLLTDAFGFPPGYKKALTLTLALRLCRPFGRPIPDGLKEDTTRAIAEIQGNNSKSPRISSADYGASSSSGAKRGDFNYYSGGPSS